MEKPDCTNIVNSIPLYIDNMLSEEECDIVREHLAKCPHCRQEFEIMKSIMTVAASLPEQDVPQGFHDDLMNKIRLEEKQTKKIFLPWRSAAGLVAAAAVVALSVVSYLNLDKPNETPNPDVYLSEPAPLTEEANAPEEGTLSASNEAQITEQTVAAKAKRKQKKEKAPVAAEETSPHSRQELLPEADAPTPASVYTIEGRSLESEAFTGVTEMENPCIVTVTVDEASRGEAEEILSAYDKDAQGYVVGADLSTVLERLSALSGYSAETNNDSGAEENYIILK